MKNTILVSGFGLVVINTFAGLIMSNYSNFNMLLVDLSLILTTVILWINTASNFADGFKIGLSMAYSLTGFIRLLCALFAANAFENNFTLIIFLIIVVFEYLVLMLAKFMNKVG
jgi:hypothetical protein